LSTREKEKREKKSRDFEGRGEVGKVGGKAPFIAKKSQELGRGRTREVTQKGTGCRAGLGGGGPREWSRS